MRVLRDENGKLLRDERGRLLYAPRVRRADHVSDVIARVKGEVYRFCLNGPHLAEGGAAYKHFTEAIEKVHRFGGEVLHASLYCVEELDYGMARREWSFRTFIEFGTQSWEDALRAYNDDTLLNSVLAELERR